MEVIGDGFLARHARRFFLPHQHPDVTLIAAGVSSVVIREMSEFDREAEMVYGIIRRCAALGRTLIFLSTASAGMYGAEDSPGTEDGPIFPLTAYGRHKLGLETVCAASDARWLILRLGHIVGSGQQPHQLLPSLTRQLLGGHVRVFRNASRDLLDVQHMLAILDSLLTDRVTNEVINLASGMPEPIERIVDVLEEHLGVAATRTYVDSPTRTAVVNTDRWRAHVRRDFGFGPDYLPRLIARHIDELADTARQALSKEVLL
jgi:nucleoside-diphosphate-sugar epimerase